MYLKTLITTLFLVLLLTGCDNKETSQPPVTPPKEEKKLPLTLKTTTGEEVVVQKTDSGFSFSGYEEKAVLLNFFATWCAPCVAEIPHLNNLEAKYQGKFKVLSVLLEDKNLEELKSFMTYNNVEFAMTYGAQNYEMAKLVGGVNTIPFMILYNKAGLYATHYVGAVPEEMIDADIEKVLK